jgi:hypothetical protein
LEDGKVLKKNENPVKNFSPQKKSGGGQRIRPSEACPCGIFFRRVPILGERSFT